MAALNSMGFAGSLSKKGLGWWVGADLNCLRFRGGFTDPLDPSVFKPGP